MASRMGSVCWAGTTKPETPSLTMLLMLVLVMPGSPAACASQAAMPPPSPREGSAKAWHCPMMALS